MRCPNCGHEAEQRDDKDLYCDKCGYSGRYTAS